MKQNPVIIGKKYINGENLILGRLASRVAKLLLEGYEVYIFNCEKIVVTGKRENVLSEWKHKILERGDWYKGPFYPKRPDNIVRRVVRGMLPKNERGRLLLKRLKCYIGIPEEYANLNLETFSDINIKNREAEKGKVWYVYLSEISKHVGYNL